MQPEEELLARLDQWLAAQEKPPTLLDVVETGDGELVAAFILKALRETATDIAVERLGRDATATNGFRSATTAAVVRVFDGISHAWALQESEEVTLLGLHHARELQSLRASADSELPSEILERIAILVDIFKLINTLLPRPSSADAWVRKPNRAPLFAGQSALEMMTARGLDGLREVRAYLQAQVWST